jgi:hypothetical protein
MELKKDAVKLCSLQGFMETFHQARRDIGYHDEYHGKPYPI